MGQSNSSRGPRGRPGNKKLRRVNPWIFWAKLILLVLLLTATGFGVISLEGIAKLPFQIVLGVLFAHAIELVHQCLHKTATGRTDVDHFLGMVLGWLGLVSLWYYLYWHWWHHRNNGTEEDQESFGYAYELLQSPSRRTRILGFLWHLSQLQHYFMALSRMYLAVSGRLYPELKVTTPEMPDHTARLIQRDYRIMTAILSLAVLASFAWQSTLVLQLWLVPLLLAYGLAHALIELPEHFQCDHSTRDVSRNTRTIKAGRFMRWLTNFNDLHREHHYDPHIPMDKLPTYAQSLQGQQEYKYLEVSYLIFYICVLCYLWKGNPAVFSATYGRATLLPRCN